MLQIREKINYDCDVIISGGGPAGSAIAYHLAKAGLDVIVLEADKFPKDKVCGDGVSPIAINELDKMGITKSKIFKSANEITKVGLFVKDNHAIVDLALPEELPYHARIIPRLELDNSIYETAKKVGAKYKENCRVTDYKIYDDKVVVFAKQDQKTIQFVAKIIVGADGSRSIVRRKLLKKDTDETYQLVGLRAYYDNVNGPNDRMDVYFIGDNFPGIYWFFPEGKNGANIGLATLSKTFPTQQSQIKSLLTKHISENKDIKKRIGNGNLRNKIEGWPIMFYDAKKPVTGNRTLLVGEAAGLINPLSGDGIQYALLSARWATEIIVSCHAENDFSEKALSGYKKRLDDELGYDLAFSNLIVHFPRNKSLLPLWMTAVDVLVARAKKDKEFAQIIVGISEGTFPSFKALTSDFVLKILLQGGDSAQSYFFEKLKNPNAILDDSTILFNYLKKASSELVNNKGNNIDWLSQISKKVINVSKYSIRSK
jgi:menaquinone-9 beta-reductase